MGRLSSNLFWRTLQAGTDAFFQFLGILVVAHILPKQDFGRVALVLACLVATYLFFDFGISKAVARFSAGCNATKKGKNLAKRTLGIVGGLSLAGTLFWLVFHGHIHVFFGLKGENDLFLIAGIGIGARLFQYSADSILQGRECFRFLFVNSLGARALGLLLIYAGTTYAGAKGAVFFIAFNPFLVSAAPWIKALEPQEGNQDPDWPPVRKILEFAFPLGIAGIMGFLYTRADIPVIRIFWNDKEVAIYEIAERIFQVPLLACSALAISASPISASHFFKGNRKKFKKTAALAVSLSMLVTLPAFVVLFFFPGPLLGIILPAYGESAPLLRILALVVVVKGVSSAVVGGVLIPAGHPWILALVSTIGAGLNIGLDFLLVPGMGAKGAAISTLIGHSTAAFITSVFSWKLLLSEYKDRNHEKEDKKNRPCLSQPDQASGSLRQDNLDSQGTGAPSPIGAPLRCGLHDQASGPDRQQG